jgi:hypothetical protein
MSVFDHETQAGRGGTGRVLLIGAGVVALLAAGYAGVTMMMPEKPAPKPETSAARSERVARPAPKPAEPVPPADSSPARSGGRSRPARAAVAAPALPAAPTGPVLVVESDVEGASVFVDRKYVGTTPLRTTEVTAGTHQINASATGEDGLVQSIDVGGTGETSVVLTFREVRLNLQLAVVHKHGIGSCAGTLTATPGGISYRTDNAKDAFAFPLRDLEVFEIDYLKKELKVKQRGGRALNFTDKSENADKLFVFHRDVAKAKEKLAAQGK